jgi:hypothetical protein
MDGVLFRFPLRLRLGCSVENNKIGDAGAKDLAEAIEVNGTMTALL